MNPGSAFEFPLLHRGVDDHRIVDSDQLIIKTILSLLIFSYCYVQEYSLSRYIFILFKFITFNLFLFLI